jgi:hypothetical protein
MTKLSPEPSFSFPFDILHVSDTHFRASARANQPHLDEWGRLVTDVKERIANKEFKPDLIAFTGDLIETAVGRAPWAMRNGIAALLDLAKACQFIDDVPSQESWPETLPQQWWDLFNKRIVLVPGNHDVFFWGLRCLWHRRSQAWQRGVFMQKSSPIIGGAKRFSTTPVLDKHQMTVSGRDLVPESDVAIGPLAVRLIDCSGSRSLNGLGTVAYEPRLGGGNAWTLSDMDTRLGIALVHGHPIELPFYLHGMFDGARGMLMENAGLLLKALAQLNIRLVLHGHRHYPGTWGITLPDKDGAPKPLIVVGAGSPTKAPSQWKKFSYNWVRIHPDRKIKVTIVERPANDGVFVPSPHQPFIADRGDFWYERVERHIIINGAGDISATSVVSGFRIVPGRPPVRAIPFRLDPAGLGYLAAWQFSAEPRRDKRMPWTQDRSVIELNPPHDADATPIDLKLRHYIHNAMALNVDEAREMGAADDQWEWTQHVLRCETGVLTLSATLPPATGDLAPGDYKVIVLDEKQRQDHELGEQLTAACEWSRERRRLAIETRQLPPYGTMRLAWRLKSGAITASQEVTRTMQTLRRWQHTVLAEARSGKRPLNDLCAAIAASVGYTDVDVTLFVPDLRGARSTSDAVAPRDGGMIVAGEYPLGSQPAGMVRFGFGEGIAGRALRTCKLHIHDVVSEEQTLRTFENGKRPSNFYKPVRAGAQQYERLLMVPVLPFDALSTCSEALQLPSFVLLGLCIGSKKPTAAFTNAVPDVLTDIALRLTMRLSRWIAESADASATGDGADRWTRTQPDRVSGQYVFDDDVSAENTRAYTYVPAGRPASPPAAPAGSGPIETVSSNATETESI